MINLMQGDINNLAIIDNAINVDGVALYKAMVGLGLKVKNIQNTLNIKYDTKDNKYIYQDSIYNVLDIIEYIDLGLNENIVCIRYADIEKVILLELACLDLFDDFDSIDRFMSRHGLDIITRHSSDKLKIFDEYFKLGASLMIDRTMYITDNMEITDYFCKNRYKNMKYYRDIVKESCLIANSILASLLYNRYKVNILKVTKDNIFLKCDSSSRILKEDISVNMRLIGRVFNIKPSMLIL
ncbi:MAG: hypothetical protein QXD03_05325 [Candidatus Anstonellales archaeon]